MFGAHSSHSFAALLYREKDIPSFTCCPVGSAGVAKAIPPAAIDLNDSMLTSRPRNKLRLTSTPLTFQNFEPGRGSSFSTGGGRALPLRAVHHGLLARAHCVCRPCTMLHSPLLLRCLARLQPVPVCELNGDFRAELLEPAIHEVARNNDGDR